MPTTRQSIHGRAEAMYDQKYHPMDDYIRRGSKRQKVERPQRRSPEQEAPEILESIEANSSDSESEGCETPTIPTHGERRSKRIASTQKKPLYNTNVHPQDRVL